MGEVVRKPRTRASRGEEPPPEDELGVTVPLSGSWWSQFVTEDDMTKIEHSGKLVLLMDILRQCELIGDKVLVFSQSLVSLDLIEEFLQIEDKRNEENRANMGCEVCFLLNYIVSLFDFAFLTVELGKSGPYWCLAVEFRLLPPRWADKPRDSQELL